MEVQFWTSVAEPLHWAPEPDGAGLEQVLVLILVPTPQLAEQGEKSPQTLQFPSIAEGVDILALKFITGNLFILVVLGLRYRWTKADKISCNEMKKTGFC